MTNVALLSAANFTTIDAAPLSIWGPVGKDINLGSTAGLLFAWDTMLVYNQAGDTALQQENDL